MDASVHAFRVACCLGAVLAAVFATASESMLTGVHWAEPAEYAMLKQNGIHFVVTTASPTDTARQKLVLDTAESTGMKVIFGMYTPRNTSYSLSSGQWTISPEGVKFLQYLQSRPTSVLALFVFNEPYWLNPFTEQPSDELGGLSAAQLRGLRTKIQSIWPGAKIYHDIGAPSWWAPGGEGWLSYPRLGDRYADATGIADYVGIWQYPFKTTGYLRDASLNALRNEINYIASKMAPAQPILLGQASSAPAPDNLVFPTKAQISDWNAALRTLTAPAISWYVWRQNFYPDELWQHPDYLPLVTASGSGPATPAAASLTPASGSGSSQTFTCVYSDANGASDLAGCTLLINTAIDGRNSCWLTYDPAARSLWLASDDILTWTGYPLGSSNVLQNSQCAIDLRTCTATASGNSLTLQLPIVFKAAFAGTKNLYLYAEDKGKLNSGWQLKGSWSVTLANRLPVLASLSATPNPALAQQNVSFSASASDPDGDALSYAWSFGDNSSGSGANLTHAYAQPGVYTARVTVSDGKGGSATGQLSLTVKAPKLATLIDDFNDNVLNSSKWSLYQGSGYSVSESYGQLRIANTTSTSNWGGVRSVGSYDAGASEVKFNLVNAGNAARQSSPWTWLKLSGDSANAVEIGVNNGQLYAKQLVAGVGARLASRTYVASSMAWLRLRESAGTTFWEYAASGSGPWYVLHSRLNPIALTLVQLELGAGAWPGISSTTIFDNINIVPNRAPVISTGASVSPSSPLVGQSATFTVAANDPDGDALSYAWSFGDGASGSGASVTHTYASIGTYIAKVTIRDSKGATATSQISLTVNAATPQAPTIVSVTPSSGSGGTQAFSLVYSDTNGASDLASGSVLINSAVDGRNSCWLHYDPVARSLWMASDDIASWNGYPIGSANSLQNSQCSVDLRTCSASLSGHRLTVKVTVAFKPAFAGSRNIYMYAEDKGRLNSGWQLRGSWLIPGANQAPIMTSNASATPNPAQVGQSIAFLAAASDADGDALSYSWTFGDGSTATGASISHAYAAAGTYTAQVAVTDPKAGRVTSSVTVTVNANAGAANAPLLILHDYYDATGADPAPSPSFIKSNEAYLSTTPFDGFSVSLSNATGTLHLSTKIMNNVPVDENALQSILAPLSSLSYPNIKHNFALVFIDKPADYFDDWTETINNFGKLARAVRANGLKGIIFDNEQYLRKIGDWPIDVKYTSKTLDEYRAQARLRGKQIMQQMVQEFPEITVMSFFGAWVSEPAAPAPLFPQWQSVNELIGPLYVGFTEGLGPQATHIDGGELYHLRSATEFRASYDWRKYTIAAEGVNSPNVPPALRSAWPQKTAIGFGVADRTLSGSNLSASTLAPALTNALLHADKCVWWYPEQFTYLKPASQGGASVEWLSMIAKAKQDARLALSPSSATHLAPEELSPASPAADSGQLIDLGSVQLKQHVAIQLSAGRTRSIRALRSSPLPAGLRLRAGKLEGRPLQAGQFEFELKTGRRQKGVLSTQLQKYQLTVLE